MSNPNPYTTPPPVQRVVITDVDLTWSQTWTIVWPFVVCTFAATAAIAIPIVFALALILGW